MRDYAKVAPQFWSGETGRAIRKLGRDVQVIALYLQTCPSSNWIGLYYLPIPTLCHETGIDQEGASKGLIALAEANFAHFDADREVVFVVEMARYQIAADLAPRDKRVEGIRKDIEVFKKSTVYPMFLARYSAPFGLGIASPLGGASKGLARGIASETETETETETEILQRTGRAFPPVQADAWGFDEVWTSALQKTPGDVSLWVDLKRRIDVAATLLSPPKRAADYARELVSVMPAFVRWAGTQGWSGKPSLSVRSFAANFERLEQWVADKGPPKEAPASKGGRPVEQPRPRQREFTHADILPATFEPPPPELAEILKTIKGMT